jgi:uncharacterized protein YbjT (DUF2867 family)
MTKPTILVTGATGKTGSAVVAHLRAINWPVRAVVRRHDWRSEALQRQGADTVVADLHDPEQLAGAMRGAARAYYCPAFHPHMVQTAASFVVAAREAKLESIVAMSQWIASPAHPALSTRQTWLSDQLLAMVPGTRLTVVNPGFFADNYLRMTPYAAHLGIFPALYGQSRNAPPSNEDIARVSVAALIDPAAHGGRTYRPTGPALLSTDDIVRTLGKVLRRKVVPVPMPNWLLLKAGRMQGASIHEMSAFLHYLEDHRQGAFEAAAPNDDVLRVTGRPAETFEETAKRYAARPEARATAANRAKAWFDFLRTPLSPGWNLRRYEAALYAPAPAAARYAMHDRHWRAGHAADNSSEPGDKLQAMTGAA